MVRFERVLKNLHPKEDDNSKFLCDFNPMHDRKTKKLRWSSAPPWRPRRKVMETLNFKKDEDSTEEPDTEKHSKEDESSKFLCDFNPMHDHRTKKPRRKVMETSNSKKDEDSTEKLDTKKHSKVRFSRVLKNLHSNDGSKFLCDFNPMHDRKTKKLRWRPRRKVVDTLQNSKKNDDGTEEPYTEKHTDNSASMKTSVYDKKGVLLFSGLDLCDCLEFSCPGCHFPCSNCSSPKCGHVCRYYTIIL